MKAPLPTTRQVLVCVALAFVLWAAIFGFKVVNFWLGLSLAAGLLMAMAVWWTGLPMQRQEITLKNTALAFASAAVLYAIFALARWLAIAILPFAPGQIGAIYTIQHEAAPGVIALVLIFLTSPCEEIFWRGFLQRWAMHRYGGHKGWLLASCLYAGVHVASGNLMLTGAALVAGLFWGYVYLRTQSLYVCIVSHAVWTVSMFLLWPLA